MNKWIAASVLAVIVVGGGVFFLKNKSTTQPASQTEKSAMKSSASDLSMRYVNYTPDLLNKAEQGGGRTVIFFAALAWCPYCQAADNDFKAHFDKVPKDVTIVIANYDTESALKQKYNITHQDGFVQVDKNGNSITQWTSGGQGVQALLDNIKSS